MSLLRDSWLNFSRPLWEREVVGKLADHVAPVVEPNPHDQYLLEADAVQVFSFAAYGGMYTAIPTDITIGLGWDVLKFDSLGLSTPRGVTVSLINNTMAFDVDGVYTLALTGSILHDSVNFGREFLVRIWNVTDGSEPAHPFRVFTGRNADGTNIAVTGQFEITEASKGHDIRFEVGGTTSSYAAVNFDGELSVNNVGEWREPLPSDA